MMSQVNTHAEIGVKRIYKTTFKKGHMLHHFHFEHDGNLDSAVRKAKEYLNRNHLIHIHTVPFIIDLDEYQNGLDQEEIDIT